MKKGVIRLDMDIKVIEQMVEQALKEIKAEQPQKFTMPKAEPVSYTHLTLPTIRLV